MERRRYDDNSRDDRRGSSRDDDRGRDSGRDREDRGRDSGRDRGDDRGRDRDDRGGRDDRSRDDRGSSRGGGRYEYQARDASTVRERAESGGNFDRILKSGVKTWKPNDKDNTIRILPPTWKGKHEHYGLDIYVHYGVGADRQTYLCPNKMKNEACPICEERQAFARTADLDNERDKAYLKELDARQRVLLYLIDRDHEREGVQAWAMPASLDRDIVKISQDKRSGEVYAIDHPKDGFDVQFEKTGSRDRTKYEGVTISRRSSELGDDRWLDYAMENPLDEQLNFFDYDHIAKEFGGGGAHTGGRDRDRGDDRGGRDRDDRGRDSRDDDRGRDSGRDRDRGDDRGRGRGRDDDDRGRNEKPTLDWESIHGMTGRELEDLIESERLKINPREAKDDDDLADWICDEMGIKKEEKRDADAPTRRRVVEDGPKDDDLDDRMRRMRERRD